MEFATIGNHIERFGKRGCPFWTALFQTKQFNLTVVADFSRLLVEDPAQPDAKVIHDGIKDWDGDESQQGGET